MFGYNPNTPSLLINSPPALEAVSTSETVASNLNALHAARRAFIQSESSERLQRALRNQVRPSIAAEYANEDMVLFKRNESNRWMGPSTVIGYENKQVLIKHGGTYVRAHACRIQRYPGGNSSQLRDNYTEDDVTTISDTNTSDIADDY